MNEEANDQDEFIEAPEDDEFGDYESPENENPEAVQGMVGGPSWVFPDLVRVQSNSGIIDAVSSGTSDIVNPQRTTQQSVDLSLPNAVSANRSNCYAGGAIPRNSQPRILDPPDVSLLSSTSSSISASNQQNTIDLCNTVRPNSKLNFSSNLSNPKNGGAHSPATSSPNSIGSSSSNSSSISTSLSGLILSSISSSQSNIARNNDMASSNGNHENNNCVDYNNPTPSTSGGYNSTSTLLAGQKVIALEREIHALELQKAQLQQQLLQREGRINELQQTISSAQLSNVHSATLEETIVQRIDNSFERLSANLGNSITAFERRIEHLENDQKPQNGTIMSNGNKSNEKNPLETSNIASADSGHQLAQMLIEMQKRLSENHRQEMCSLFRNILTSAVREIDNFSSSSSTNSESASIRKNAKTTNLNGL